MNRDVKLQIKSRTAGKRRLYYVLLWIGRGWDFLVVLGLLGVLVVLVVLGFLVILGILGILEHLESLERLALACHFPRVSQHHKKACER